VVADLRSRRWAWCMLLEPGNQLLNAEQPCKRRLLARLRIEESGRLTRCCRIEAVVLTPIEAAIPSPTCHRLEPRSTGPIWPAALIRCWRPGWRW